jgi:hypothetical protein
MNAAMVIAALDLPVEARVEKRVPKKLLFEHGAPTAADRKQIQDGIEELTWVAAIKPSNIGVPAYRDDVRDYPEIAVLASEWRPKAKAARLTELIHRAIPYPVVLVVAHGIVITLSLAHKRMALNETAATIIDGSAIVSPPLDVHAQVGTSGLTERFLESLPLGSQARVHLCAVYQGWIDRVEALRAGCITGQFALTANSQAAAVRRVALVQHDRIQMEIASLRGRAVKETQINRRVELNLSIRRLEGELAVLKTKM